jgi:hypothetical protein
MHFRTVQVLLVKPKAVSDSLCLFMLGIGMLLSGHVPRKYRETNGTFFLRLWTKRRSLVIRIQFRFVETELWLFGVFLLHLQGHVNENEALPSRERETYPER